MFYVKIAAVLAVSYAIGCICTGYYLTKLLTGKDIRQLNSKSTGARNVRRVLRWKGFTGTLAGDFGKGAAVIAGAFALQMPDWVVILCAVSVTAGHIWPVQLGFHGGRGVATAIGALTVFDWRLVLGMLVIFAVVFALSRKYMLSGIIALLSLVVIAIWAGYDPAVFAGIVLLTFIILLAHRGHISNILSSNRTVATGKIQEQSIQK
ncbi:MAG: glycerol-3-phosphate acyltransferase [Candidatus Brocadiia bacterium]|nr:MAG: glycerol-3-phosphate acyltransferase [Candidatus Brocadiia bacterium]